MTPRAPSRPGRRGDDESPPRDFPQVNPEAQVPSGHDFTLQAVMEMQRSLGQMSAKVDRLIEDARSNRERGEADLGRLGQRLDQSVGKLEDSVRALTHWSWFARGVVALGSVMAAVAWWLFSERIEALRQVIINPPGQERAAPPSKAK